MKKNGFTLVEILAVVAIIAVLSLIVVPNIIKVLGDTKKNNFVSEAREVYNTATNQHIMDRAKGLGSYYEYNSNLVNVPEENQLDVSTRPGFGYYVIFNEDDEIISFYVRDNKYKISLGGNESNSIVELTQITLAEVQEFSSGDESLYR